MPSERVPTEIKLHQKSRVMEMRSSRFSPDRHSTGIYSWDHLYELGQNQDELWTEYLKKLQSAGASR